MNFFALIVSISLTSIGLTNATNMLRFFVDLSFCKIAELFGKTESWARVTYHRAKAKLKEALCASAYI